MEWPFVKRARFNHVRRLSERWGMENCRLWETLMWIDTYDPEIIASAENRFRIDVKQGVVYTRRKEPPHDH